MRPLHPALHLVEVQEFLNVFGQPLNLRPRYNIAPTTTIDVVRLAPRAAASSCACDGGWCRSSGRSR